MKNTKELLESTNYRQVINLFQKMDFTKKEIYANWLAQTYYFVCHSVRLSSLGASRCDVDDPIGKRMAAHTIEEKGHHTIAKSDLKNLDENLENYPVFGLTKAFYESQYYKVLFEEPSSLLGQILMLEAFAVDVGPWFYETTKTSWGEKATNFIRVHANEDKIHVIKAMDAIDSLNNQQKKLVINNFYQACEMYSAILNKIADKAIEKKIAA
ncbi:MAG TPA: iron-containing redox enzyme family protein [Pseudobdellovibrionaceae bacterium]|nr:iron-containing redox enzyme family protein [Pseudobdellovibrionaceae bacterium]